MPLSRITHSISFLFFLIFSSQIKSQENNFIIPDSLNSKSFDELNESFKKNYLDTIKCKIYLNTIIAKANKENNLHYKARANCYLSYYTEKEFLKLEFLDKSIQAGKDIGDDSYLLLPYSFKGVYFSNNENYSLALDYYLKTLEVAEKVNSLNYIHIAKHNIAHLKANIGKHNEALPLFKEAVLFEESKKKIDTFSYLKSIISLAESYRYNMKLDSATIYNSLGINLSKNIYKKENIYNGIYPKLVFNEAFNLYHKNNYGAAIDSLNKALALVDVNNPEYTDRIILSIYYKGKIQKNIGNNHKALNYYIKLDSLIQKHQKYNSEVRDSYEFLINNYKKKNNTDKQLEYINKLLQFDSIIYKQRDFVTNKLFVKFDQPTLLKEKQLLIKTLREDRKSISYGFIISIIISLVISVLLFLQYKKRKKLKRRFDQLIKSGSQEPLTKEERKPVERENNIGVPDKIIESILNKLDFFEENNIYIKKDITVHIVSKELGTNSKYLSKIINKYKKKSFTMYINDLRIQYIVDQLKANNKLRNYSIQGLAEEVGFNKAESFSSAFKKYTGMQPSYFIKHLNQIN